MITDVLAIGPHPDDLELSAGGTLAALVAGGKTVGMMDLTRGERGTRGTPEIRAREANAAAVVLGASFRECIGLPDGGISRHEAAQLALVVAAIRRHRPRVVITLHQNDDHPDHIEGAHLVRQAAYLSGLRNFPEPDGHPHRPSRILFAMGRRPFPPSLIVDVTAHHETKQRALAAYASQFLRDEGDPLVTPISDPGFLTLIEARDRTHGGMIGVQFGEAFFEDGPVAVPLAGQLVPEITS